MRYTILCNVKGREFRDARSGIRTHECFTTADLKSAPIDQLGHTCV